MSPVRDMHRTDLQSMPYFVDYFVLIILPCKSCCYVTRKGLNGNGWQVWESSLDLES